MARPTIVFNNSTGSDTQASGAGPATAVFGTGASLASSTAVDLSADAPDLSGVATDGSAALWVVTSSGRKFSRITAVDNSTKIVTVATAYGVTESSRTWAIGGKRSTPFSTNSLSIWVDAQAGWGIELQEAGSVYSHTAQITMNGGSGDNTDGPIRVFGTGSTRPTIALANTGNVNGLFLFSVASWHWDNLIFDHSGSANIVQGFFIASTNGAAFRYQHCRAIASGSGAHTAWFSYGLNIAGTDCVFIECTISGYGLGIQRVATGVQSRGFLVLNCEFFGCTTALTVGQISGFVVDGCVIYNCTTGLLVPGGSLTGLIKNNTIHNCSTAAISLTGVQPGISILNNNLTGSGVGVTASAAYPEGVLRIVNNNFGTGATANTTDVNNVTKTSGNLNVAPGYANAGAGNFTIARGSAVQAKAYPEGGVLPVGGNPGATYTYVDIGASQHEDTGGGGGSAARIFGSPVFG